MPTLVLNRDHWAGLMVQSAVEATFPGRTVALFHDAAGALAALRRTSPDLVVAGMTLDEADGLDFIPEIRAFAPAARVIVVTRRKDLRTIALLRKMPQVSLVDASTVDCGEMCRVLLQVEQQGWFHSLTLQPLLVAAGHWLRTQPLSAQEELVFSVLGSGQSNEDAAPELWLPPEIVRGYRARIMSKLGLHQKGALICYAIQHMYVRITPSGVVLHPGFDRELVVRGWQAQTMLPAKPCVA